MGGGKEHIAETKPSSRDVSSDGDGDALKCAAKHVNVQLKKKPTTNTHKQ